MRINARNIRPKRPRRATCRTVGIRLGPELRLAVDRLVAEAQAENPMVTRSDVLRAVLLEALEVVER